VRNRRALSRLAVEIQVRLVWDERAREGVITDLALGGLFAECDEQAQVATAVTLLVKHGACTLRIPAVVRWTSERGMGMQFGLLGAREAQVIADLSESRSK
jgi:type IV pilus assembly protein PilZ